MDKGALLQLRKFLAPEFIFGAGARHLAGRYAHNLGARKAVVVTDPGVVRAGWVKDVTDSLENLGIAFAIFPEVSPNPRGEEVEAGTEVFRSEECNVLIGVGGGSPMDCAKGIGILSTNRRFLRDFEGVDRVEAPMPPLICVPTTSGTSADVSQFVIILDQREKIKYAIISKSVVPDVSLIDPETLATLSAEMTACTGIDALAHAIEAFVSSAHAGITDLHALEAIRLLRPNLLPCLADPANPELRTRLMMGSLQAGLAFSNACLGATHAMAHSLGGLLDLPHGECNALLLPHVIGYNFTAADDRYKAVGEALGLDLRGLDGPRASAAILEDLEVLRLEAGLEGSLRTRGVGRSDIPYLARNALQDPCVITNPRRPGQRDLEVIFEDAF